MFLCLSLFVKNNNFTEHRYTVQLARRYRLHHNYWLIEKGRKCESHSHDTLSIHPARDMDGRHTTSTSHEGYIFTAVHSDRHVRRRVSRYPTKSKIPHTRGLESSNVWKTVWLRRSMSRFRLVGPVIAYYRSNPNLDHPPLGTSSSRVENLKEKLDFPRKFKQFVTILDHFTLNERGKYHTLSLNFMSLEILSTCSATINELCTSPQNNAVCWNPRRRNGVKINESFRSLLPLSLSLSLSLSLFIKTRW